MNEQPQGWERFLSDLWQVEASILGVTLVVAVLLIERRSGDSLSKGLFHHYIRRSYIVPVVEYGFVQVALAATLSLCLAQWSWESEVVRVGVLAVAIGFLGLVGSNVMLYQRTLHLISPTSQTDARLAVLDAAIQRTVTEAELLLLGRKELHEFCAQNGLSLFPWMYGKDLEPVRALATGTVVDIDLRRLKQFVEALPALVSTDAQRDEKAVLMVDIGCTIEPERDVLAWVHIVEDDQRDAVKRAEGLLRKAVIVSARGGEFGDDLMSEVRTLKDEVSDVIRVRRLTAYDDLLHTYKRLGEGLLRSWDEGSLLISRYGTSLDGSTFTPIRPVLRHLRDILEIAIATGDSDVIMPALSLPFELLNAARRASAPSTFYQLAGMMVGAYWYVHRKAAPATQRTVTDGATDLLRRYLCVTLGWSIDQERIATDCLSEVSQYAKAMLQVYADLLKTVVDLCDASAFMHFAYSLEASVNDYLSLVSPEDIDTLEAMLGSSDLPDSEYRRLHRRLTRAQKLQDLERNADDFRLMIWFGVGAYVLWKLHLGRIDRQVGIRMFASARQQVSDLHELSRLYVPVATTAMDDMELPWAAWEDALKGSDYGAFEPTGGWFREGGHWLRAFYCIQGLRLTPADPNTSGAHVYAHPRLEHEIPRVRSMCQWLTERREELSEILTSDDLEHLETFIQLHHRALEAL